MLTKKSEVLAKQSLNSMYKDSTGSGKQERIIKVFGALWLPLAVISVAISTFSIYMDLSLPLGFYLSLTIGFFFASILVIFTHYALDSLFTTFTGLSKILMGIIFIGLASLSIITHFKSLGNFEQIMVQNKRVSVLKDNMAESAEANAQIQQVLATNKSLSSVFNNGTIHDDKEAMRSISSNNQLIILLKTTSSNKELSNEIIQAEKRLAHTLYDTLLLLFIVFEILSYFSLVSKTLLALNVTEEVKNLSTQTAKLDGMKSDIYDAILNLKSDEVAEYLGMMKNEINKSPTLNDTPVKEKGYNINDFITRDKQAVNLPAVNNQREVKEEIDNCFEILRGDDEAPVYRTSTESAHDGTDYTKTTEKNINFDEDANLQNRYIDISSYEFKEAEILKVMFDKGQVKKAGDKLIPKRYVLAETKADKKDYENLTSSLHEAGYIYIKAGSGWVSNCKGIKTVVAVEE